MKMSEFPSLKGKRACKGCLLFPHNKLYLEKDVVECCVDKQELYKLEIWLRRQIHLCNNLIKGNALDKYGCEEVKGQKKAFKEVLDELEEFEKLNKEDKK